MGVLRAIPRNSKVPRNPDLRRSPVPCKVHYLLRMIFGYPDRIVLAAEGDIIWNTVVLLVVHMIDRTDDLRVAALTGGHTAQSPLSGLAVAKSSGN